MVSVLSVWLGALTTPSTQALWTSGLHPGRQRSSFVLRRLSQCSGPSPARSLATAGRDMAVGTVGGRHDVRAWVGLRGWTGARPSDLEGGTSCHGAPSLLFPALQWSGTAALAFLLRPANRVSAPGVPVMTVSQTWPRAGVVTVCVQEQFSQVSVRVPPAAQVALSTPVTTV